MVYSHICASTTIEHGGWTSQPQANEILLVSLPPSHGNNSQNKDNDKDSDSDKFAFICKRGFKYPHKTDTMMTCA